MASKAFNIREIWNPVCCHGNKTGMLILWSTSTRILLQRIKHFFHKLAEISFVIIFDQTSVDFMTSSLGWFAFFQKRISLEQQEIFENSKQHSSSRTAYMFMTQNGLERKDANFVIVTLFYASTSAQVIGETTNQLKSEQIKSNNGFWGEGKTGVPEEKPFGAE